MTVQLNLTDKSLLLTFAVCALLTIAIPSLYPTMRLSYFIPFLVIVCYQMTLSRALWIAFGCGMVLDLLTAHTRLGLYAMDFCVTLAMLYPQRRNFFADSLSTLPIMTFLFSTLSTLVMAIMLYVIEMKSVFSWSWFLTDLLVLPAADALFAFAVFIGPAYFLGRPQRRGKDYFLSH